MSPAPATTFTVPPELIATGPPESRGKRRDQVRLLVARPGRLHHTLFRRLGDHLDEGDLLVVNTSATRPAAIDALWRSRPVVVHLSTPLDGGGWLVEIRSEGGHQPVLDAEPGDRLQLRGGGLATLRSAAFPPARRLWQAALSLPGPVDRYLAAHGRPITYGQESRRWPLQAYQTVFARPDEPSGASAEMPSAGRPFSTALVTELVTRGVSFAPITLHAGVSSLERHEAPHPERYRVPATTAEMVEMTRRQGSRVVAVGTTVTRALETVAGDDGSVTAGEGWTELVLGPDRTARVVDGLITGWHPPEASHMLLLEAVAGADLVGKTYRSALEAGYLWHEFGDSCLFLP